MRANVWLMFLVLSCVSEPSNLLVLDAGDPSETVFADEISVDGVQPKYETMPDWWCMVVEPLALDFGSVTLPYNSKYDHILLVNIRNDCDDEVTVHVDQLLGDFLFNNDPPLGGYPLTPGDPMGIEVQFLPREEPGSAALRVATFSIYFDDEVEDTKYVLQIPLRGSIAK